jgi:hypothetical protein
VGDVIYGFFCASNIFDVRTTVGENMEVLKEYMCMSFWKTRNLANDAMIMWCKLNYQFVLNMQSHATNWRDLENLTGEVMNENNVCDTPLKQTIQSCWLQFMS